MPVKHEDLLYKVFELLTSNYLMLGEIAEVLVVIKSIQV